MKQLQEIREMVNEAKDRDGYATDYRLDRLCEAVDALIGYVERGAGSDREKKEPEIPVEWQEAVDAAQGALTLDAAGRYGLVSGCPVVNAGRCEQILRDGTARGYRPAYRWLNRRYPPVNEPTAGAQYDGAGHFVREAPAPGFMQPSGKRIGGA